LPTLGTTAPLGSPDGVGIAKCNAQPTAWLPSGHQGAREDSEELGPTAAALPLSGYASQETRCRPLHPFPRAASGETGKKHISGTVQVPDLAPVQLKSFMSEKLPGLRASGETREQTRFVSVRLN